MAKKNMASNPPKQQALPMSPSHSHIAGAVIGANPLSPEDDDDDICPVCESECTCQNRVGPALSSRNDATAPSVPSISTLNGSAANASSNVGLQSLKIRLTVPSNLKLRKQPPVEQNNVGAGQHRPLLGSSPPDASEMPASSVPTSVTAHHLALGILDPAAPKRRGRPPKAVVAARRAAEALVATQNTAGNAVTENSFGGKTVTAASGSGKGKGKQAGKHAAPKRSVPVGQGKQKSKGRTMTGRKVPASGFAKGALKSFPHADFSDDTLSERLPTFVSAASTSSHSSSSESSDSDSELSSLDSEIEEETRLLMHGGKTKTLIRKNSGNDGSQNRRESGGNWDTQSRKSSVGLDEEDADVDSNQSGDEEAEEQDEDSDNDTDEDEDVDADTEGDGLDDVQLDREETSSTIGVTFGDGAAGWSDDEESSFDADLFFANLDGSSDSDSSRDMGDFDSFDAPSDFEPSCSLSADEEDALLLMDIDPSIQVRRGRGEFEFGLELDSLSFSWDGQVLLTRSNPQNLFSLGYELQEAGQDVEMQNESQQETESGDDDSATVDEMALEETDGETTEDELVDSNGLPNSRAMMLFRWPSAVSAINPLSTVGSPSASSPQAPPNVSESVRIALASFSAHQGSPAPTPADILAGRISMDDLEDIEMDKSVTEVRTAHKQRSGGAPAMGEFMAITESTQRSAVIDGRGGCVPSPFPRSKKASAKRSRLSSETECNDSCSGVVEPPSESAMSSTQSSDETFAQSQLPTSELSSTDAIDLDDVLDSSFLDSEPMSHDHDVQPYEQFPMSDSAVSGTHIHSLSRWDRIPMATFRRTRETAINSTVEGSASDTGLGVYGGISSLAMLMQSKPHEKKSSSARKRSKAKGMSSLIIPNDVLSLRDDDRTPTSSGPHQPLKPSKKEVRREKAMMKRKMMSKPVQSRHQQYHNHHHHANNKSRASSSMQRMGSFAGSNSSMPSFSL